MSIERNKRKITNQKSSYEGIKKITGFERGRLRAKGFTNDQINKFEQLINKVQEPVIDEKHRRRFRFQQWRIEHGELTPGQD